MLDNPVEVVAAREKAVLLATIQERAASAAFRHIYGEAPFPREAIRQSWRDSKATAFLLGECGFAAVEPPYLHSLYVIPDYWGRGVGNHLYEIAISGLRDHPVTTAELWVLEANARARGFYGRRGWHPDGLTRRAPFQPQPLLLHYQLALVPNSAAGA